MAITIFVCAAQPLSAPDLPLQGEVGGPVAAANVTGVERRFGEGGR